MKNGFSSVFVVVTQLLLCTLFYADEVQEKSIAAKIGATTLIFYRDGSPNNSSTQFVDSINDSFFVVMGQPHPNLTKMRNIRLISSGSLDISDDSIQTLNDFFSYSNNLARECSNLELQVQYCQHECVLNQDTHGFFTNKNDLSSSFGRGVKDNKLQFENIFLYDWQLANATVGGCIFHDRSSNHRFVVLLNPHENIGILKLNSVTSTTDLELLPWTFFAPIDLYGPKAVGSWKGKYMANISRGFAQESENFISSTDEHIDVNSIFSENDIHEKYFRGMVVCKEKMPEDLSRDEGSLMVIDNMSVIDLDLSCRVLRSKKIQELLKIEQPLTQVIKIIKRDDGFSALESVLPELSKDAKVAILNTAQLPSNYSPYHLCENLGKNQIGMFQLYCLEKQTVLAVSPEHLRHLYLTPTNEVFFRSLDFQKFPESSLNERFHTEIEIFIYE